MKVRIPEGHDFLLRMEAADVQETLMWPASAMPAIKWCSPAVVAMSNTTPREQITSSRRVDNVCRSEVDNVCVCASLGYGSEGCHRLLPCKPAGGTYKGGTRKRGEVAKTKVRMDVEEDVSEEGENASGTTRLKIINRRGR